jgi:acyl carrier protein phosphodiesterase
MNFLAHLYLAGNEEGLIVGNFIADSVKGAQIDKYTIEVQEGIRMHRAIDQFTDDHPVTERGRERLRVEFNHYSGVITDIYYDHFLAKNWLRFSDESLSQFSDRMYELLESKVDELPDRTRLMLPFMKKQNWLLSYADMRGIHQALTGMSKRTQFESGMEKAADALKRNYEAFEKDFDAFFPAIIEFTKPWRDKT